jgi:hypothetical protein
MRAMIDKVRHDESWYLEIRQEPHEARWPDVDVLPVMRPGTKMIRPDVISVYLSRVAVHCGIYGPLLRKDGTPGLKRNSTDRLPEWAEIVVEEARQRHGLGEGTRTRKTEWDS